MHPCSRRITLFDQHNILHKNINRIVLNAEFESWKTIDNRKAHALLLWFLLLSTDSFMIEHCIWRLNKICLLWCLGATLLLPLLTGNTNTPEYSSLTYQSRQSCHTVLKLIPDGQSNMKFWTFYLQFIYSLFAVFVVCFILFIYFRYIYLFICMIICGCPSAVNFGTLWCQHKNKSVVDTNSWTRYVNYLGLVHVLTYQTQGHFRSIWRNV